MDGGDAPSSLGGKVRAVIFNGGYKYPIELICPFIFVFKRSSAHTSNPVTSPTVLATLLSTKSLPEELSLISVSLLFSLVHTFLPEFLVLLLFFLSPSFSMSPSLVL